jgi:hypothetical protein
MILGGFFFTGTQNVRQNSYKRRLFRDLFQKLQMGLGKSCNSLSILHLIAAFCMYATHRNRVTLYKSETNYIEIL